MAGERLQRKPQIAGRLESRRRTLLETAIDDPLQSRRNMTFCERKVRRILLQDRSHRLGARFALKRATARQHFVEHEAEREDVRAVISGHAANLFG